MHEASLMRDLMRRIDLVARQEGVARVTAVRVRLGALSHFSAAHFKEHFAAAAAGGPAAGAHLTVTASEDRGDPHAAEVTLESLDVAD